LTLNGFNDFFIVKYDNMGNEVWIKQLGGPNYWIPGDNPKLEGMTALSYDLNSNCLYASGIFVESCNFGNNIVLSSNENKQMFIAKFTTDGTCIWAKQFGSLEDDFFTVNLTIDHIGNIYTSGYVPNTGYFGNLSVSAGTFLAKYGNEGNCLWVKKIADENNSGASPIYSIHSLNSKNQGLYCLGHSVYSFYLDSVYIQATSGTRYILSYFNEDGKLQWFKQFAQPGFNCASQTITFDSSDNLYVSGSFTGPYAVFESGTIHSSASEEMFLYKCDPMGNRIWVKQSNATNKVWGQYVYCDQTDNIYVTGEFTGSANFGENTVTSITNRDLFLAKYSTNGLCSGAISTYEASGIGITSDNAGMVYVCGPYWNNAIFGNTVLTTTSTNESNSFIAKHDGVITGVGKLNYFRNSELFIYANPSTGICNISIPEELQHEENLTLLVYDNAGKLIMQQAISLQEEKISFNLQAEAKGVYNAILTNGKQKFQGRVVFE